MNETVSRNNTAVVNVLPPADRNNWCSKTTRIKDSAAIGTKSKEIARKFEVTPPIGVNRTIPRNRWVSTILASNQQKSANVAIVKNLRRKIVKPASNVGAWDILSVNAKIGPNLWTKTTYAWARRLRSGSPLSHQWTSDSQFCHRQQNLFVNFDVCSYPVTTVCDTGVSVSCISRWFLKKLPVTLQSRLQPAHRRLLAAN